MRRLQGLFRFERLLAALLTLLPFGLWFADTDYRNTYCPQPSPPPGPAANCRDSISAYHDMADANWFYIPLTIAAIMFIVNGLVRAAGHNHNAWLGFALLGVLAFDHENERTLHYIFAVIFFASAIVFISAHVAGAVRAARGLNLNAGRLLFLAAVGVQVGVFAVLSLATTLFVAEVVQLVIIAAHFIWHSFSHDDDHAGSPDPEPLGVLEEILGPVYTLIATLLTPATLLWSWVTGNRAS